MRYQAIQATCQAFPGQLVKRLCALAQVSRSAYYRWLSRPLPTKEAVNKQLKARLRQAYWEMKGTWGYRRLTMLINRRYNCHYNHKRIRRLLVMNLRAVIRRPRHSCTIARGQSYEPNLLNRDFTAKRLNEKWVTDVTYLTYGNGQKAYLSAVKDLYNGEIISYVVSQRNDNPLVMKTLEQALKLYPTAKPLLHSDRGFQYTSKEFARLTAEHGISRSMSRVGKCIDNAPMESFWSHYKDEAYYGQIFRSYEELVTSIDQYIYFYNHHRYQRKIKQPDPGRIPASSCLTFIV